MVDTPGQVPGLHRMDLNDAVEKLVLDNGELGIGYSLKDVIYEVVYGHSAVKAMGDGIGYNEYLTVGKGSKL